MLNLISALSISPSESQTLSRKSESHAVARAEQPFSHWLTKSCCDRDRPPRKENPRAGTKAPAELVPDDSNPTAECFPEKTLGVSDGDRRTDNDSAPAQSAETSPVAEDQPNAEAEADSDPLCDETQDAETLEAKPRPENVPSATTPAAPPAPQPASTASDLAQQEPPADSETAEPQPVPAPVQDVLPVEDEVQELHPDPNATLSPTAETTSTPESETILPAPSEPPDEALELSRQAEVTPVATASPVTPSVNKDPESQLPNASTALDGDETGVVPLRAADSAEGSGTEAESRSFQSHADLLTGAITQGQTAANPSATLSAPPPPAAGGPLPQFMQPATLAENLDRLVLHSVRSDPHSIRIELEPVSLGRVMLLCRETNAGLTVEIAVQNSQIRSLLIAQEQDLRHNLEAQGLQLGRFSVTCRDGEGRPDGERAGQQQSDSETADTKDRRAEETVAPGPTPGSERGLRIGMRNRWVA